MSIHSEWNPLVMLWTGGVSCPDQWAWTDEAGGFEELMTRMTTEVRVSSTQIELEDDTSVLHYLRRFLQDDWYHDVVSYHLHGTTENPLNRHELRRIREKSKSFRVIEDTLWKLTNFGWLQCLCKDEVANALREAHDLSGHFGPDITRRRLTRAVIWPAMAKDVV